MDAEARRAALSTRTLGDALAEAASTLEASRGDPALLEGCRRFAEAVLAALDHGGRLWACGNGGSMADAMHFAEEWTGRFRNDRAALPAQALADPVAMSCIANDFGWEEVFARQIEAHARPNDVLVLLSTSGSSENVVRAARTARAGGVFTVGLLGRDGGKLATEVDVPILVPRARTPDRIQEIHLLLLHAVIESVERVLFPDGYGPSEPPR